MAKDFDWNTLLEAVNQSGVAFEEYKKTNDQRLAEIEKKGAADPLLEEKLQKMDEHLDKHQETIDLINARIKRAELTKDDDQDLDKKAYIFAATAAARRGQPAPAEFGAKQLAEYKDAFHKYLKVGDAKLLTNEEYKALSVGSDRDGGYLVDPDTSGRTVERIYETSPIMQYASVQSIETDTLEGLHDLGEADTGWVSEIGARTETNTPQIERWTIPVHELYSKPKITQKLVDDAGFDVEGWLANKVADKMTRVINAACVSGNGVGKPRGLLSYPDFTAAGTSQLGALEQFDTGVNGDFAATPNAGDVLIDAIYGTKDRYRTNAIFFMNRATQGAVRKLKDTDGEMIWQPSLAVGQPATLLGYPVVGFEDMPDYTTTGALAIGFGDLGSGYQVVRRMNARVLIDPYSSKPYIEYYTVTRVGGDVIDFDAIKLVAFQA